jgi:hypothetical protein
MKKLTLVISLTLLFIAPLYAELKDHHVDIVDGIQAYEFENYEFAFEELLPFAINGNKKAQYYIGLMYQEGDGVVQNTVLAKEWLDKSRLTESSGFVEFSENEQYLNLLQEEIEIENTGVINNLKRKYVNDISAKIMSNWRYQSAEDHWTAEIYVIQDRGGNVVAVDVRNANVDNSNKARSFMSSIERAVFKSSPFPITADDEVFDSEILLIFKVN